MMGKQLSGWQIDLYTDPRDGLVLWLPEEKAAGNEESPVEGRRLRLTQSFPVTFYAAGSNGRLRALWCYLASQDDPPELARD